MSILQSKEWLFDACAFLGLLAIWTILTWYSEKTGQSHE